MGRMGTRMACGWPRRTFITTMMLGSGSWCTLVRGDPSSTAHMPCRGFFGPALSTCLSYAAGCWLAVASGRKIQLYCTFSCTAITLHCTLKSRLPAEAAALCHLGRSAGRGSHANYPHPGTHGRFLGMADDHNDQAGVTWNARAQLVQPWPRRLMRFGGRLSKHVVNVWQQVRAGVDNF